MLRASISFFIMGIVCMALGVNNIAGLSIDIGKILLLVFFVLSLISFFMGRSRGKVLILGAFALLSISAVSLQADDTVKETAKEVANDSVRASKDAVRVVKDKTCSMVKGKMECAVQKAKHTIQKGADKVEDAVD